MDSFVHHNAITDLLQKYIENKCSEQELRVLLAWLKTPENVEDFDLQSHSLWKRIDAQVAYPDKKRAEELNAEVDFLIRKIKQKNTRIAPKVPMRRNLLYRIAAVFLLLLSIGTGVYMLKNRPEAITYKEVCVGRGETKEYTLDDGTHVILNSQSKIVIPSDYNANRRCIEVIGEGFFDVAPNPEKPFIIKNGNAQVKVVGTSFNLKAYEEDEYIQVTVSTGKVLVNVSDLDLQLRVTPSEHLSIHKTTGTLSKLLLDENYYNNWIKGNLYFEKEPLREVVKTLNRRYAKNVVLHCGHCGDKQITGIHDNKSMEAVIESICFTSGLRHREDDQTITLYE